MKNNKNDISSVLPKVDLSSFTEEERLAIEGVLSSVLDSGNTDILERIFYEDYDEQPVTPAEFLSSSYYLGSFAESLYPKWKDELIFVLDPKNAINEWIVFGSIGTGKCCRSSTLATTSKGLLTMEEVYHDRGNFCALAESGYKNIVDRHDEGDTETRLVTTKAGRVIEGRPNHRLRALTPRLEVVWKNMEELATGDILLLMPDTNCTAKELPNDVAEGIGWIVAEGSRFLDREGNHTAHSVHGALHEKGRILKCLHAVNDHFSCFSRITDVTESSSHCKRGACCINLAIGKYSDEGVWDVLSKGAVSSTVAVPKAIRTSGHRTWKNFLRGLFSGDGTVDKHGGNAPVLTTTSESLAYQVQTMLTALGVYSTSRKYTAMLDGRDMGNAWDIRVVGLKSRIKFAKEIGFWNKDKQELLEAGLKPNRNDDHKVSFRLDVDALRNYQPKGKCGNGNKGPVHKTRTPRGLCHRLKTQKATVHLLEDILEAGGVLPSALQEVVNGTLMLDTVDSVEDSSAHCYDISVADDPSYIAGGFISHNTVASCVAQLYKLYVLSCMKNPQKLFGLASHMPVYFAFFSTTKTKAADAINAKFQSMLNLSPYFREKFPKNPRKVFLQGAATLFGAGYKEHAKSDDLFELVLPHNIHLLFGSQTGHALSLDVFSATLDEMNFRSKRSILDEDDENSAKQLYHQVRTRIESRFISAAFNPGLLINISSARSTDSFVEERIKEVREHNIKNAHISDFALWDVKPGRYGTEKFRVFVGSGFRSSRILVGDEVVGDMKPGEAVISVPTIFKESFVLNIDSSIRDLAGIPTAALNKLFKHRELIVEANDPHRKNPLMPDTIQLGVRGGLELSDFFDLELVSRYDNVERHLLHHPMIGRFVHVDLAKNADCAGISSVCIPYYYEKTSRHYDVDREVKLKLPFVFVDFVGRIQAPDGDEISFEKIRQFIVWLRDVAGYPITGVSYDSWQSVHSIQLLQENGFETDTLSVDKTDEPYMELYNAFGEHRLIKPAHVTLDKELRDLEHDIRSAKAKVDHPRSSSKDVSDSLCGAYFQALTYIHKNGFGAVGAHLVTEAIIKNLWNKHQSRNKAARESREMGYKEPIFIPRSFDTKFQKAYPIK